MNMLSLASAYQGYGKLKAPNMLIKEFFHDKRPFQALPPQGTQSQHVKRLVSKHMKGGLNKNASHF
jgi:hypothetical protein